MLLGIDRTWRPPVVRMSGHDWVERRATRSVPYRQGSCRRLLLDHLAPRQDVSSSSVVSRRHILCGCTWTSLRGGSSPGTSCGGDLPIVTRGGQTSVCFGGGASSVHTTGSWTSVASENIWLSHMPSVCRPYIRHMAKPYACYVVLIWQLYMAKPYSCHSDSTLQVYIGYVI